MVADALYPEGSLIDIAMQPDGRIVTIASRMIGVETDFLVARFNRDGSLDDSFGSGGTVVTDLGTSFDLPAAVALQSDGRIVVVGHGYVGNPPGWDVLLSRYHPSGVLDSSFGAGGRVRTDLGTTNDRAADLAIQPDGRIVVTGSTLIGQSRALMVLRYTAHGGLDASFGFGGAAVSPLGSVETRGAAVAVQRDGRIVVAGTAVVSPSSSAGDLVVARFTGAGALDPNFGTGGARVVNLGGPDDSVAGLGVQSDGRIVVAGHFSTLSARGFDVGLARLDARGAPDATFGSAGLVTADLGGQDLVYDLALQQDGRIILSGSLGLEYGTRRDFAVLRFDRAGQRDPTFGIAGVATTKFSFGDQGAVAVALSPDGRIVAAGWAVRQQTDAVLVRFLGDAAVQVDSPSAPEVAGAVLTFTVSLSAPLPRPLSVQFSTADGTATAGRDYTATAGTLQFATGETTRQVTVPVLVDAISEPDESAVLDMSVPNIPADVALAVVAPRATGTIVDDTATGYRLVASDGGIFAFGDAGFLGSAGDRALNQPIVGMAATPSNMGYWLVASDGGVFAFGDAGFLGSTGGLRLARPIVGMAATPSGKGYWLVASDGGVFAFGDAGFLGSTGALRLTRPIVGIAATPMGRGYRLVASDGGIFAFGDAGFLGSTGDRTLNQPVVGLANTSSGKGYWLVALDGGIFSFGDATFLGSTGAIVLNQSIVGMAATPMGRGYWLVALDGGIFSFGTAAFLGSSGGKRLNRPVVAMAAPPRRA